jgi:hypothetical protein
MVTGVFLTNNNITHLKDDSLYVTDEIINNFITGGWFTNIISASHSNKLFAAIIESSKVDPIVGNEVTLGITTVSGTALSQKWRLYIYGELALIENTYQVTQLKIFWGTELQLPSTLIVGAIANLPSTDIPFITLWDITTYPNKNKSFFNYALTIVQRGFVLSTWRNNKNNTSKSTNLDGSLATCGNKVLCIQRPVVPTTGIVKNPPDYDTSKGKIPVFALCIDGNLTPGNECQMSIVRERDINASSPLYNVSQPGKYTLYGINLNWTHPNILNTNAFVIKIPFGFCTNRYMYPEEMDLVAFTNATNFISYQETDISMYGRTRKYTGTWGNVQFNYLDSNGQRQIIGGSRICLLSNGFDFI